MKNTNRLRLIASIVLITGFLGYCASLSAVAGSQALGEAVRRCDLKATQKYIEAGIDINSVDNSGRTPLINAVDVNCSSLIKLLIDKGAQINAVDTQGMTPLHYAATKGNTDLVLLLLAKGSNINDQDKNGNTPLHMAVLANSIDAVKALLDKGADINIKNKAGQKAFALTQTTSIRDLINHRQLELDEQKRKAQEQEKIAQEKLQDKQRVAKLTNDELRYELDLRWQKLQAAHAGFPIEKLFRCCADWARSLVGGSGGGLHTDDYIANLKKMVYPAQMALIYRDKFLQTGGRGEIYGSQLSRMGTYPNDDRRYFDCVYDLTIDTEIAKFGHIYKLTPQEEADIKAKAKADPLKPLTEKQKKAQALTQERLQDKERVTRLSNDQLRGEIDLRWQKLHAANVRNFPAVKLFECFGQWRYEITIVFANRSFQAPADVAQQIKRLIENNPLGNHNLSQVILTDYGRGVFLQTTKYKEVASPWYGSWGEMPEADRRYLNCVYDLTIDTEVATFGHIYKLTAQEEADIKAKAKADPLVKK